MRMKKMLLLSFGHMTADLYPGMLSPLLPILLDRYGLSLTLAGMLVMVQQLSSNLSQPVAGILNDNRPGKLYLWLGPLIAGVPFGLLFYAGGLTGIAVALAISGLGVGMYHPVGAVVAGKLAQEHRKGFSMALFSSGGSVGFMIAPLFTVLVVEELGTAYLPLAILPAVIAAVMMLADRSLDIPASHHVSLREWLTSLGDNKRELVLLWLISSSRAVSAMLFNAFLPILAMSRGMSYVSGAYFLSASLFSAMIGMFLGGHFADVYGNRKMIAVTMLCAAPFFYAFLFTEGILSTLFFLIGMASLSSTIPVNVLLAQHAAPKNAGMASSLVMGLSFGVAALAATPYGMVADAFGIGTAALGIAGVPLAGGILVLFLRHD